jgi:hypothetical protein
MHYLKQFFCIILLMPTLLFAPFAAKALGYLASRTSTFFTRDAARPSGDMSVVHLGGAQQRHRRFTTSRSAPPLPRWHHCHTKPLPYDAPYNLDGFLESLKIEIVRKAEKTYSLREEQAVLDYWNDWTDYFLFLFYNFIHQVAETKYTNGEERQTYKESAQATHHKLRKYTLNHLGVHFDGAIRLILNNLARDIQPAIPDLQFPFYTPQKNGPAEGETVFC